MRRSRASAESSCWAEPVMRATALSALLMLAQGTCAAESIDMVLGRIVWPRPDAPSLATTASARAAYVLHCAGCHRVDGAGAPEKYVPDLRALGQFLLINGGREYVIKVPGVMGSGLDDHQVADVMNWLFATLARDSAPADHRPYSAAEVTQARATPLLDVAATRSQLLQRRATAATPR